MAVVAIEPAQAWGFCNDVAGPEVLEDFSSDGLHFGLMIGDSSAPAGAASGDGTAGRTAGVLAAVLSADFDLATATVSVHRLLVRPTCRGQGIGPSTITVSFISANALFACRVLPVGMVRLAV